MLYNIILIFPGLFKGCFWPENPLSSWRSDPLLHSWCGTHHVALQRDGVPHLSGEVAGLVQHTQC